MKVPDRTLDVLLWYKENHKQHEDPLDMAVCAAYDLGLNDSETDIPTWMIRLAEKHYM